MVGIYRSYGAEFIFGLWFYKDAAPDGAGGGGTGAEAQWLFLPEPDTRKNPPDKGDQGGIQRKGAKAQRRQDAKRILDCGGRAQRRHRFSTASRASKAAWRFASRRGPNLCIYALKVFCTDTAKQARTPDCSRFSETERRVSICIRQGESVGMRQLSRRTSPS